MCKLRGHRCSPLQLDLHFKNAPPPKDKDTPLVDRWSVSLLLGKKMLFVIRNIVTGAGSTII